MVREIVKDVFFLGQKSVPASLSDMDIAEDLLDTIKANSDRGVGMAANMIGKAVRIIVFTADKGYEVMFNPEIMKYSEPYETSEGCLSLDGERRTKRYRYIKVRYQNEKMQSRIKTYTGWTAQIIQHEIDHCNGIII